ARALLHKSINTSTTNQDQKAVSFLKLAQLDYEDEAYVTSKYFYDSTLTFMAKNDDRYEDISERDKMLDNLVKQLTIIHDEDSLQKMAALPKEEIDKRIKEALAQKEKEDEEKKEAAEAAKQQNMVSNPNNTSQNGSQGSNWYFYSTTARANGYNDFIRKWGRRNLEENWRRKDKSSTTSDEDNTTTETTDTTASKKDTVEAVKGTPEEQMYAAIPDTKEKMDRSVDRIVDAYYAAGTIYKDGLESYGKARDMFEALNERYPGHKLLLESYYNLYLIALKLKQPDKMEYYKKLILDKFPESVIGKVLRDPNYINQARKKEQAIDDYYQSTYEDYDNNRLDSAWIKCEMSNTVFKPNPLSAKFDLLEAMILMKENRLGDYVQALNKIINRSSDVAIKKTATDLLANLNKSKMPQIDLSKDPARRDSLNALYKITPQVSAGSSESSAKPDTAEMTLLQKLEAAKELAIKQGKFVDTTAKANTSDTTAKGTVASNDTASNTNAASNVVEEDTTSPYKRSDAAAHYFIVYIKDPQAPQSAVMSILAKVNAFNSLQFSDKRLQGKYTLIDSKNRTLNVRQFLNREDAMQYFSAIKGQTQLFDDLKPEQYTITVISSSNFITLLSNKNIDEYMKFFNRIYK
ncbi:MAG TPA: hypothetical protein VG603_13625, partial [Chitinophagales bacterium]|nr:hypothetical protein [Chitinophagales bacterium]